MILKRFTFLIEDCELLEETDPIFQALSTFSCSDRLPSESEDQELDVEPAPQLLVLLELCDCAFIRFAKSSHKASALN